MNLVGSFMLFISGGLTVASMMTAKFGYDRSVLSRRAAAVMSGIGVGIGCAIFAYYGFSNGDFSGSVCTGFIAAFSVSCASYFSYKLF